jgi:hypothetical protein
LASLLKKRTTAGDDGLTEDSSVTSPPSWKKRNAEELLAAAVTGKVEDGNIKAAIRILCSEEKPAMEENATYTKLLERHPNRPVDSLQIACQPYRYLRLMFCRRPVHFQPVHRVALTASAHNTSWTW